MTTNRGIQRSFVKNASSGALTKKSNPDSDVVTGDGLVGNLIKEDFQKGPGKAIKNLQAVICGDDPSKVYFGVAYFDRNAAANIPTNPDSFTDRTSGNLTPFAVQGGTPVTVNCTDFTSNNQGYFALIVIADQTGGGDAEMHYAARWYTEQ